MSNKQFLNAHKTYLAKHFPAKCKVGNCRQRKTFILHFPAQDSILHQSGFAIFSYAVSPTFLPKYIFYSICSSFIYKYLFQPQVSHFQLVYSCLNICSLIPKQHPTQPPDSVHIFSTESEAKCWHWSANLKQNGSWQKFANQPQNTKKRKK